MNNEELEIKRKGYKKIEENCKLIKVLEEEQKEKTRYFYNWFGNHGWLFPYSYYAKEKKLKRELQKIDIKIALLKKSNDEIYEFLKGGYRWA